MPDADLVAAIRAVLAQSPFHGEGHRKVWARLRLRGIRTSLRRVLRLMRGHGLLAPSRAGGLRGLCYHDGTIIPDAVDVMWGTDMTATWTNEGQVAVFIAIDHHSAECVGIHAARYGKMIQGSGLRGAGADPSGSAPQLKSLCQGYCLWSCHPSQPQ
jgi:transposase InsO family protein